MSSIEQRYRRLLRWYPRAWRLHHEDEVVAVLLDQADADGRTRISRAEVVDVVGHGLEERVDRPLRRIPERFREQVATVALVAAAVLGVVLLLGELWAAPHRDPLPAGVHSRYFESGPLLSIGVVLHALPVTALVLVVRGRAGLARLLSSLAAVVAVIMACLTLVAPVPRIPALVLVGGLALLAAGTRLPTDRARRRLLVRSAGGVAGAVLGGLLMTRWVLGWSVGTMTTSGNVAYAALAVVLPAVAVVALLVAGLRSRRSPGWAAAVAVAALPVVVFCTIIGVEVNGSQVGREWIPLAYVVIAAGVGLAVRRRQRRRAETA